MKKIFVLTVLFMLLGCAGNSNKPKLSAFPGPRVKITLQLPDPTINRQVTVQLHRFGTKEEKADGIKEYRENKSREALKGKIDVEIPPGIYDIFIDVGDKKYCLLGTKVSIDTKKVIFSPKDIIQE